MQQVLAALFGLVVGQRVAAVAVAMIATAVLVAVLVDAARDGRRRRLRAADGRRVELASRELAVLVATAGFDVCVAVEEALGLWLFLLGMLR